MSFVLSPDIIFKWPCKTRVPDPESGKRVGLNFEATFRVVDQSVVDELIVDRENRDGPKFLEAVLVKVEGFPVHDADGNLIEDDEERNAAIIKSTFFIEPLITGYSDGVVGKKGKN